jgi:DNA replication protein DnaC
MRTTDLVQRLQAARQMLQLESALAKLDRFDLLMLAYSDDVSHPFRSKPATYSDRSQPGIPMIPAG